MFVSEGEQRALVTLWLRAVLEWKFCHGLSEGTYRLDNRMWREQRPGNQANEISAKPYPHWIKNDTLDAGVSLFDELIATHYEQRSAAGVLGYAIQMLAAQLDLVLPATPERFFKHPDGHISLVMS